LDLIGKNILYSVRGLTPAARAERAREVEFDRQWGTWTTGFREISSLDIPAGLARDAVQYEPSDCTQLHRRLDGLGISYPSTSFIDFGCGMGRPLLVASQLPFRKVVGVDISAELIEIAARNVKIIRRKLPVMPPIELVLNDAGAFEPPAGDLVCYLYNPFGISVLRRVVVNLEAALARGPRKLDVIYVNPVHLKAFAGTGWLNRTDEKGVAVLSADSRGYIRSAGPVARRRPAL
jgi:SAM-dependent methyltransferase